MNWDALGALAELLGAIAVVGTIGYLAHQTKQANRIARTSTVTDIQRRFDELNAIYVSDAGLRLALHKTGSLSEDEAHQIYSFTNIAINIWISVQNAHDNGLIDRALFEGMIHDVGVAMDRWPNSENAIGKWLEQYPGLEHWEIFNAYHDRIAEKNA